jgi:hypothetical protein
MDNKKNGLLVFLFWSNVLSWLAIGFLICQL